jgi:hypothetical protein
MGVYVIVGWKRVGREGSVTSGISVNTGLAVGVCVSVTSICVGVSTAGVGVSLVVFVMTSAGSGLAGGIVPAGMQAGSIVITTATARILAGSVPFFPGDEYPCRGPVKEYVEFVKFILLECIDKWQQHYTRRNRIPPKKRG